MAKEILDQIRGAEDQAQEIINLAQINAREIVRAANEEAEKILADTAYEIKAETAQLLKNTEMAAVREFDIEKEMLLAEIEKKRKDAADRMESVRAYILGRIL